MRRCWILSAFCVCAAVLLVQFASANSALRLNQAKTKASLLGKKIAVALALENAASRSLKAHIKLELLDAKNRICATSERNENIISGLHIAAFELSLKELSEDDALLWYRLRYEIKAGASPLTGILALSEITPEMFEIRVAAPVAAYGGNRYRTSVIAVHPVTSQPIGGVKISGEIKLDDEKSKAPLQASGVTNDEGYAVLEFQLPQRLETQEINLKITGEYKGLVQEVEEDIQTVYQKQFLINSDKLIYQPGQTLHVRALLLDAERRALADQDVMLSISDEDNLVIYRATLKTSRLGIASADWHIPGNIRLGEYEIKFRTSEDEENWSWRHEVRISRYELPNFSVQAKPDRSYYLPNQKAQVEVRGEYLFGQAVLRGRVKVVRESERHWNFREQKWDIEEEEKYEGELDKAGRFVAALELSKAWEELEESNYRRFQDVSFTAYLTDLTTNRTEQRRFDVRLTKEAIHVYLIEGRSQSKDFPMEFYASTFYADGAPAECQIAIREVIESQNDAQTYNKLLRTVKTNKYGLAKVENLFVRSLNEDNDDVPLNLVARDRKGLFGQHEEKPDFWEHATVRIKTDKPIYRAGEPITLQVAASKEISTLFIDLQKANDWQPLFSQTKKLINGRATITIPYQENFKSELRVSAYTPFGSEAGTYAYPSDSRYVIYANDDELKLHVAMSQSVFRPGEEASAELRVTMQGAGVESALGVTVFDKAVDERTRTDNESGARRNYFGNYSRQFSNAEEIAGVNRSTLNQAALSKPLPQDLQLVAEFLLRGSSGGYWKNLMSERYTKDYQAAFKPIIDAQLSPILAVLGVRYKRSGDYPTTGAELRREMNDFGLDFDALRDPLGTPYGDHFFVQRDEQRLNFISAGVDRKLGTDDDFVVTSMSWRYFKPDGEIVDRALENHHTRTGQYIDNLAILKAELRREGRELAKLRDPWGRTYRVEFGVEKTQYSVAFQSGGADQRFKTVDDFTVWTSLIDYTRELKAGLGEALNKHYLKTKNFPQNDEEFAAALKGESFDSAALRDGWGKPLYATYKSESRYADRVTIYSFAKYPEQTKQRTDITPVTQQIKSVTLRSRGADNKEGTYDDFDVAKFSRVVTEQTRQEGKPDLKKTALRQPPVLPDGTGAISGLITDPAGALITNAKVTATNKVTALEYRAITDEDGRYTLNNLPAGLYDLKFEAQGFMKAVVADVAVTSANIKGVDVEFRVGAVQEAVMLTAGESPVQTESTSVAMVDSRQIQNLPLNGRNMLNVTKLKPALSIDGASKGEAIATPRLREYFPETLLWQPEIVTDAQGRVQVKFKLADNVTTWKFSAIASTLDGRIAVAEREVRAFQPFFIEHDPPRILTAGDKLALPIVLRNYLDKAQTIKLELNRESWFETIGASQKQSEVAAGDSRRETFDIRAALAIKDGKQRVTAICSEASDAVEKSVSVHPDGEEITQTTNQIFSDAGTLEINIPAESIKNSTTAELKIYPNLMAHVLESIEAIMQRPYGCGEQTISAAYPSLLALRHGKQTGDKASPTIAKAQRYVQLGYEKLLNYRGTDGGFSYWGRGDSDFALTAYALKFLIDASEFVGVDQSAIDGARDWLLKYQQSDGGWVARD